MLYGMVYVDAARRAGTYIIHYGRTRAHNCQPKETQTTELVGLQFRVPVAPYAWQLCVHHVHPSRVSANAYSASDADR